MKKLLLLPLLFAATMVMAEDAVVAENFSGIKAEYGGDINTTSTASGLLCTGDVCQWKLTSIRWNGTDDKITVDGTKIPCMWLSKDTKIETTNLEGGVKAVSFRWAQYGKEASNTLQLKVSAGTMEDELPTRDGASGANNTTGGETYSHVFECKSNAQLTITNISTKGGTNNCRILVGSLVITPYLFYTTKAVTFDLSTSGTNKYTNPDFINNTGSAPVYSISDNTIGATIDATTGEVTADKSGEVTVTASWESVSTSYKLTILAKGTPTAAFEKEIIFAKISESAPVNTLTTNSTAAAKYSSSKEGVATVDETTGALTIVDFGTTVIKAELPENDDFFAVSASYTLRVVPANFKIETFDGAENVDLSKTTTYLTTATESTNASTSSGLKWTSYLGSVRDALGGSPSSNMAAAIRGKKSTGEDYAYLLSSTVAGGIDSLAFDWNANGDESARNNPWNIEIYINDKMVGSITDACAAIQPMGSWFRYTLGNLKVEGNFTIKFVNKNITDNDTKNNYRWVVDNIEWYSYGDATGMESTAVQAEVRKVIEDGKVVIYRNGIRYNLQGQEL